MARYVIADLSASDEDVCKLITSLTDIFKIYFIPKQIFISVFLNI